MTEAEVVVIVKTSLEVYERETGLPRHQENLGNFGRLFELANKAKGAIGLAVVFIGVPGSIASFIVIIRALKGHF